MARIPIAGGNEVETSTMTVAALARCDEQTYERVLSWVVVERQARAERAAQIAVEQEQMRQKFLREAELREQARQSAEAREWKRQADLAEEHA